MWSAALARLKALLRAIDRMLPPLEPSSGPRPLARPKPYKPPGPDLGLGFAMLLTGIVVWGTIFAVLAHFW